MQARLLTPCSSLDGLPFFFFNLNGLARTSIIIISMWKVLFAQGLHGGQLRDTRAVGTHHAGLSLARLLPCLLGADLALCKFPAVCIYSVKPGDSKRQWDTVSHWSPSLPPSPWQPRAPLPGKHAGEKEGKKTKHICPSPLTNWHACAHRYTYLCVYPCTH